MQLEYKYNRAISIALVSILLHFLFIFFLFFDIQLALKRILHSNANSLQKTNWANRNPGNSRFGAPVVFKTTSHNALSTDKSHTKTKPLSTPDTKKIDRAVRVKKKSAKQDALTTISTTPPKTAKIPKKAAQNAQDTSQKAVLPPMTIAHLLQGFLEQKGIGTDSGLRHKGNNKQAPDEQIKYERYVQKIHWSIQNTFKIYKNRLTLPHAVRAIMQFYIDFQDNGFVKGVQLLKPSGSAHLDQFMLSLIQDAIKSFPPFPRFLDAKLIPKVYTLHIDIPAATHGSNLTMSL